MQSDTVPKSLRDLVRGFNTGSILLPQFQRDYVWTPRKIRNLLDSLLNDLPIGGFYLWQATGKFIDQKPKAYRRQRTFAAASAYLIDGQQRLTSLEAAFGLFSGEDKRGAELRCYLDLSREPGERRRDTRLFVSYAGKKSIARRIDKGDPTLVDIKRFYEEKVDHQQRVDLEAELRKLPGWSSGRVAKAMERYDRAYKMLDQRVPCTTVQDVTDDEAVEIFNRLNKGGNALREGDVRAAELARGHAVNVLKKMRDFVAEERPRRLGFGFSFAFRALVVFHRGSAQFSALAPEWINTTGPHKRSLSDSWATVHKSLDRALKFVDEKMGWSRRAFIPSNNAIIVLAFALDKASSVTPSPLADQRYRSWLCLTALRGVFQGSVETTINRFVRAVRETTAHPSAALLNALTRNEARRIQPEELTQYAQLWGPATQILHVWLVRNKAKDWLNGESIDSLARAHNVGLPGGDLTVHHIFPRAAAAKKFVNPKDANCLANFAIISRESNSQLKDRDPEDALELLTPKQRETTAVQFFSSEAGDRLKSKNYEDFRQWRAQKLADAFNVEFGAHRK
jgi:hypothetical protein